MEYSQNAINGRDDLIATIDSETMYVYVYRNVTQYLSEALARTIAGPRNRPQSSVDKASI